ncbi:MAG: hypothetical protein V3U75_11570 [Methylococcaceae bacterium]
MNINGFPVGTPLAMYIDMKNTYEKITMIADNNRGREVAKTVEVIKWSRDGSEPSQIVERKAKKIVGCSGKFDRYMYVSGGRCTSVNVGKATKNYDMAYFIKVPVKK